MRWYKARINHTLYGGMTSSEFLGFHKMLALTSHMEKMPTKQQLLSICTQKIIDSISKRLENDEETLSKVLEKVLEDVDKVHAERTRKKAYMQEKRENVPRNFQGTTRGSSDVDKIRGDKIRLDNTKREAQNQFPPSLEEITNYCQERNNKINPQSFIDFYSSKGWMVGKNKMKDWKACIRTWESRETKERSGNNGYSIGVNKEEYRRLLAER
jgi:hypothetical protein